MSFATGFAAGVGTGQVIELRKARRSLRDYAERLGLTIRDRQGRAISIEELLANSLPPESRKLLRTGIVIALLFAAALGLAAVIVL